VKAPVEFTPWDPRYVAFGFAMDISMGGAFVETSFPSGTGRDVVLRLSPPGWEDDILLSGIVRWIGRGGMGVEFVSVGWREAAAIRDLVTASVEASESSPRALHA
jgi:hypothetical protein